MSFAQLGSSLGSGFAQMGGAGSKGGGAAGGWGSVIGTAIQIGFDIYNGRQQRKQVAAQHRLIRQRNDAVFQEMQRSLATIAQDRALAMMRIQEAKWAAQAQTNLFRSNLEVNQAASGMVGQSFDALASDLKRQRDEAITRLDFNAEITAQQYRNQAHALINQAVNGTVIPAQQVQSFDLESALRGIGDSLPAVTSLWGQLQDRRVASRTTQAAQAPTGTQGYWVDVNRQRSAGLSYNLGLY